MPRVLLDTGPFVALLAARDRSHAVVVATFRTIDRPLVTTEAVLTETLHLLRTPRAQDAALEFVLRGAVELVPSDARTISRCRALMTKYADVPMDFADATLVCLAEDLATQSILTLDRRGFRTYRVGGRRAFDVLP